jgi:hypothetical protein
MGEGLERKHGVGVGASGWPAQGSTGGVQPKKHAPRPYVVVGLPFKSVCCSKGGVSPVTAHAVSDEVDGLSLNTTFTLSVDIQGNKGVKFFV